MRCNSPYQGGRKKRQDNVSCMVQLQAESARQGNTEKYCLLVPNTWQNRNQGLPDAVHAGTLASGTKKQEYLVLTTADDLAQKIWFSIDIETRLYISTLTWPVLGHPTSSKYLHYHRITVYVDWRSLWECFERTLRDRLDLWKMGVAFDTPLRCENSRLFNAFAKSLLHAS